MGKMNGLKTIACDLLIIGSGMAGMAAALFAVRSKIDTVQVGVTGQINFASGLLDLLGIHPLDKGVRRADPWTGIERLVRDEPQHPYARLTLDQIRQAMEACLEFLDEAGLPYATSGRRNCQVVTPNGTVKTTYAVPKSMAAGVTALENQTPALLVDFSGLKGYSARQIVETLGPRWPELRSARIEFPGSTGELYTEHAARALDRVETRKQLAARIVPHIGSAQAVGLPAVLGIYRSMDVLDDLERLLKLPVFEIPTMLPAVTGLRLRETFEQQLPRLGVRAYYQQKVLEAQVLSDNTFRFLVGAQKPEIKIKARGAILASGRFFGKGLRADRFRIRETIFDLPVAQPEERTLWHHNDLLHPQGHPINRAGLNIDDRFRPVDADDSVIHPNLYAAGSILAHQDWIRQKCGSGLSIATAYGAVDAFVTR
jgi:glycerol-3-phosphate dehydrogenase subunit B